MISTFYLPGKLVSSSLLQRIVVYLFLLCFSQFAISQDEYEETQSDDKVSLFELNYQLISPRSGFRRNITKNLHGVNFSIYRQLRYAQPHFIGLVTSYSSIATETGSFLDVDGFFTFRRVTSNWLKTQLAYRVYPKGNFWKFDPFVSALLGANINYTTVNDSDPDTDESLNYSFEDFDLSIAYGVEIGSHFNITDSWLCSFKLAYQTGSISKYLISENQTAANPLNRMELKSSSLETLNLLIGLTFAF